MIVAVIEAVAWPNRLGVLPSSDFHGHFDGSSWLPRLVVVPMVLRQYLSQLGTFPFDLTGLHIPWSRPLVVNSR